MGVAKAILGADKFLLGAGVLWGGNTLYQAGRRMFGSRAFGKPGLEISDPGAAEGTGIPAWVPIYGTQSALKASGMDAFIRPNSFLQDINQSIKTLKRPLIPGSNLTTISILTPAILGGAGVTGAAAGLVTLALTRNISSAMLATAIGGAVGGVKGYQLARGTSEVMGRVATAYYGLDTTAKDYRAFGGGRGFRTWYKRPGGRMSPGHLGADGTLPLAMHRIRNRSTVL